jgi:hypothetical protein
MFKVRNLAIAAALIIAVLSCTDAAFLQQQNKSASGDLALEIDDIHGQPSFSPIPFTLLFYQFTKVVGWQRPSSQTTDPSAVKLVCNREGDSVRIDVSVLLGQFDKLDTPRSLKGIPEKTVAVYFAKQDETIYLRELPEYGIEPFEIKVVSAKPPVATAPQIINKTKAVEVAGVEESRQQYHLSLKNISSKNIIAFNLYVPSREGKSSQMVQGTQDRPAIKSGALYEMDVHISTGGHITPQGYVPDPVEQPKIVIGTVVFDDGTFEGETEAAADIEARQKGRKVQLSRIVELLESILDAPEDDTAAVIEKLRTQVSALTEEADMSVVDELMSRYPTLSAQSKGALAAGVKMGLNGGKQEMLFEIKEFERARAAANGNMRYRTWVSRIKEQYDKLISPL